MFQLEPTASAVGVTTLTWLGGDSFHHRDQHDQQGESKMDGHKM